MHKCSIVRICHNFPQLLARSWTLKMLPYYFFLLIHGNLKNTLHEKASLFPWQMISPQHSQWWHLSILEAPQGSGSTRRGHLSSLPRIIHLNSDFPFLAPSSHMCFPSHTIPNTHFSDRWHLICLPTKALLSLVTQERGSPA